MGSWILDSLATTKRFSGPMVEPEKEEDLMNVAGRVPAYQPVHVKLPASEQTAYEQSDKPAGTVETAGGTVNKPAGTDAATPTASEWEKLIKENGYVGAFQKMYPKTNYEEDIRRQEKRRQMDLIAQMAQVGMQTVAAGMGARRFTPVTSNRQAIDDRIEKLREAQKLADQQYGASMLQTAMQEFKEKQQREERQAAQAREDERWNKTFDFNKQKYNEGMEYQRERDAKADEASEKRAQEAIRHNMAMEAIQKDRYDNPDGGSSRGSSGKNSKKGLICVVDNNQKAIWVDPNRMSRNEFWQYAKNALVKEGRIRLTASMAEVYKELARNKFETPWTKELAKAFPYVDKNDPKNGVSLEESRKNKGKIVTPIRWGDSSGNNKETDWYK